LVHSFFFRFIAFFLHMFHATMCPSSGENTITMRHLVFVTVYGLLSSMQGLHTRQSSI
jgi:hypothetical protein